MVYFKKCNRTMSLTQVFTDDDIQALYDRSCYGKFELKDSGYWCTKRNALCKAIFSPQINAFNDSR